MQKILIDTDPGQDIDDLLAIWFAMLRPELDVVGITTVTWPAKERARLIKRLLRYLGRQDVPVAAGMEYPLRAMSHEEIDRQHDLSRSMNHSAFAEPLDSHDNAGDDDAVNLIIRTVERHPGQISLACIAPLTNIACALSKRPDIAGKIQNIAMMGGELAINRVEHNAGFDYAALAIVLASGIPIYMGTWDVTRRLILPMSACERFRHHGSPIAMAMADAIELWHPAQSWKTGPVMYDLFPMVMAFDRSYYTTQPMAVRVETQGQFTRGMTVTGGPAVNVEVTTDICQDQLRELFYNTVLSESNLQK